MIVIIIMVMMVMDDDLLQVGGYGRVFGVCRMDEMKVAVVCV